MKGRLEFRQRVACSAWRHAAVMLLAILSVVCGGQAQGEVALLRSESVWLGVVAGAAAFDFTATNTAKANEVGSIPGDNEGVGSLLTFDSVVTGLPSSVVLEALELGSGFVFNDNEGGATSASFVDALSVGDIDNYDDDDFQISLSGGPIYGVGIDMRDNDSRS